MSDRQPPWYEREGELPVLRELIRIREVGLVGLRNRQLEIPTVIRAARLIAPNIAETRQYELVAALFDALLGDDDRLVKGKNNRVAARVLFGCGEYRTKKDSEFERRKEAADVYGYSYEHFRRDDRGGHEPALLRQIADTIEELLAIDASGRLAITDGSERDRFYVTRTGLEDAVRGAISNGAKLIYLVGDAGTGKSSLARHIACTLLPEEAGRVAIAATTYRQAIDTMTLSLADRHVDTRGLPDAMIERSFVELLSDGVRAPRVVLFDDLGEYELPRAIADEQRASIIIVTSRKHPGPTAVCFDVGNMAESEAVALIERQLPGLPSADAARLAATLDCRPLAIKHSCGFLGERAMSVGDFCAAVEEHAAEVLDSVAWPGDPTLTAIYRIILEEVATHESALRLLDLLVHCPPGLIGTAFAKNTQLVGESNPLDYIVGPTGEVKPIGTIRLYKAFAVLSHLSLVRLEQHQTMVMHQLTRAILRDLRAQGRADALRRVVHRLGGIDCPSLRDEPADWYPFLYQTILEIDDPDPSRGFLADLANVLRGRLRSYAQPSKAPTEFLETCEWLKNIIERCEYEDSRLPVLDLKLTGDRSVTTPEIMRRYREALEALDPDDRAAVLGRRPRMTTRESDFLRDYAEFMNGGIDYKRRQRTADALHRHRRSIESLEA